MKSLSILALATMFSFVMTLPQLRAQEASVKPGINDSYLDPALQVTPWVERLEKEGREVYDQRARIIESAGVCPGMIVADIGSGTGLFTRLLSKHTGDTGTVYAVDIVPKFLDYISKAACQEGYKNIKTVLCTERSVELPENSVDLIFICDTYHHFEYPKSTMATIHKALKPGGRLVLVEFERIPGKSSDWILNHVRAGREVFTQEIVSSGFSLKESFDFLKENYVLTFESTKSW